MVNFKNKKYLVNTVLNAQGSKVFQQFNIHRFKGYVEQLMGAKQEEGEYTERNYCSASTFGVPKNFYKTPQPRTWVYDQKTNATYKPLEPCVGIFCYDRKIEVHHLGSEPKYIKKKLFFDLRKYENIGKNSIVRCAYKLKDFENELKFQFQRKENELLKIKGETLELEIDGAQDIDYESEKEEEDSDLSYIKDPMTNRALKLEKRKQEKEKLKEREKECIYICHRCFVIYDQIRKCIKNKKTAGTSTSAT